MQDTINVYRYQLTSQNLLVPKLNSIAVIADLYNYIYRMHIVNYYSIKQFMHAVTLCSYSTASNNFHFQGHSDTHNSERLSHSSRTRNPKSTKIENQQKKSGDATADCFVALCKMRYSEKTSMRKTLSTCNCT